MTEQARGRGRPRDDGISRRALQAARELLVERGFDATTMQAVADHAGLHASALYRRWPSRIELIEEATFPGLAPEAVQPTGDLRADLHRFIETYLESFSQPAARAAATGLFTHRHAAPRTRPPELYLRVSARPHFRDILRAAPPGAVDPSLDPDEAFTLLLGAILTSTLLGAAAVVPLPADRITELIIRTIRPTP